MKDFKAFLNWTYPQEILQERQRVLEDIVRFVLRGAEDRYEVKQHPSAGALENDVRSRALEAFLPMIKGPKRFSVDPGSTAEILISAIEDAKDRCSYGGKIAGVPFKNEALCEAIEQHFNTSVNRTWAPVEPSVQGALNRALENLQNTETRVVLAYALATLVRQQEFSQSGELQGLSDVLRTLFERRTAFMLDALMFAGLIGGSTSATIVRQIAEERCHRPSSEFCQLSVMQFLTENGGLPGHWSRNCEDQFRADIREKFDALGEVR